MNPNQKQQNTEPLDQSVVALSKAIGQSESGGKYDAKGKSGEYGAYQFTQPTWKTWAKKHLGDENAQMTPENQDKVAYSQIKEWGSQGYKPSQIASLWNSGKPDPTGNVGVNKYGVKFDTPKYVASVGKAYDEIMKGQKPQQDMTNPSNVSEQQPEKKGLLSSIVHGLVSPVATMVARPIQTAALIAGASPEDIQKTTQSIAGDYVAPVPTSAKDVVKDVGRGLQTAALGMPVGKISQAVKMGAVAGSGAGLEEKGTLSGALKGGAIGAGTGLAGGLVSKAISALPKWLTKSATGMTDEQATQMLATKSIGSRASLLAQSEKSVAKQGEIIRNLITKADEAGIRGAGNDSLRKTLLDYPEYSGQFSTDKSIQKMLTKIKNLVRGTSELGGRGEIISAIDKIANGTATLSEKNIVRSAIDQATSGGYAKLAKALQPSAGHELAMTFANNLRDEVQSWIPDTIPLFKDLAKEMNLKKVLVKLANKGDSRLLSYNDILPYFVGQGALGGLPGGLLTAGATRLARSPATGFALAKGIKNIGKITKPITSRAGLIPMTAK